MFKGLKEIKIFNLSNFFDKKFNKYNNEYTENFIHYQKLVFLPKYLLESSYIVSREYLEEYIWESELKILYANGVILSPANIKTK